MMSFPKPLSVFLLAVACAASAASAAGRPNIVLIISDDQDFMHLGFMGNSFVQTPTLDRLAEQGTVFTTAHLPMSRCHPTLASFLSGRWPHQTGIYYNYGEKKLDPHNALPRLLRDAGYVTYAEGKYWEGDPRAMGFTHGKAQTARTFVRRSQDDLFAFVDQFAGERPMFIWWAPMLPHTPHNPPRKYLDAHDWSKMPIPPYMRGKDLDTPGTAHRGTKKRPATWRHKEQLSYAMEAWLDDGVRRLVGKLRSAGQLDNTMFVFVIDNGWCNGLPSKGTPFEHGVRTPVFFTLPGTIPSGRRFDHLISTNDIYPTILEYAGVEAPETAAGRSLRPLIEGRPAEVRETLFGAIYPAFATKGDNRAERDVYALYARTAKWKYILFVQDVTADRSGNYLRIQSICCEFPTRSAGDEDLYDLESDPFEQNNLAKDVAWQDRLRACRTAVLKWWANTGGKQQLLDRSQAP